MAQRPSWTARRAKRRRERWQRSLIATERQIEDGYLTMSERPGLGWEIDWDYIDRYRITNQGV